jgi:hypothetical protein
MDFRKARGREIALLGLITRKRDIWLVPSLSRIGKKYRVVVTDQKKTCTCPDFLANGRTCKHIHAVQATIHKVDYPPSNLVDPLPAQKPPKTKRTYPQHWPSYNAAQTNEKPHFMELLAGLCEFVENEEASGPGRPSIPRSELAYLMIYKVYGQRSTRRFMSDANFAERSGFVDAVPHFNSIINGMNDERMTDELHKLIEISSLPFVALEQTFAADSSGFSVSEYERWQEIKPVSNVDKNAAAPKKAKKNKKKKTREKSSNGNDQEEVTEKERQMWSKLHLMCGVRTHVITAAVIKDRNASDTPQLPELIEKTAHNFTMNRLCADKAYGSLANYNAVAKYGIDPFIPFKSNHSGAGKGRSGKEQNTPGGQLWNKKFRQFMYHREEFEAFYHVRSNVETVFSMIKRNFGAALRSKTERAMLNEVLCKAICHNILCIVKATYELGLEANELRPTRPRGWNPQVIEGGRDCHQTLRPA